MATWNKETYDLVANSLNHSMRWAEGHIYQDSLNCQTRLLASEFAHIFSEDNPEFDSGRFYRAIFEEEG